MLAAWYETQGSARDVLVVGEVPAPTPGPGELRIRMAASGINPGDLKKRQDAFGLGMPYPRVIPHSDGAGVVDAVGEGVSDNRVGERVWCFGAQSYRAFGTAAEASVVPAEQAIRLPDGVDFQVGACLGIPSITAHRCLHAGGSVAGRTVLVQGGAGSVGTMVVGLAQAAGAHVLATVRSTADVESIRLAGAEAVLVTGHRRPAEIAADIRRMAPDGVHHIVEVAFDQNINLDMEVLAQGGSIAAYATTDPHPRLPFWQLLFKNARLLLLGSDDFPLEAKREAAAALNELLAGGWQGIRIDRNFPLVDIVQAHEYLERKRPPGRVVVIPHPATCV